VYVANASVLDGHVPWSPGGPAGRLKEKHPILLVRVKSEIDENINADPVNDDSRPAARKMSPHSCFRITGWIIIRTGASVEPLK